MAIKTYTQADMATRISEYYAVRDLWLDTSMPRILLDEALVAALERFHKQFGKPLVFGSKRALYATDGHSANSFHYKGQAADFSISGVEPLALAQYAEKIGMGGIGVYKDSTRHIHMDTRSKRTCWWVVTANSKTPGFGGEACVFRQGDRSPAVKAIQKVVGVSADGVFGTKTELALKAWQAARGLAADGVYGKDTNGKMGLFNW